MSDILIKLKTEFNAVLEIPLAMELGVMNNFNHQYLIDQLNFYSHWRLGDR